MDDTVGLGCNEGDNFRTSAETMGDTYKSEKAKGKVNITMSDKTNKILILVSC